RPHPAERPRDVLLPAPLAGHLHDFTAETQVGRVSLGTSEHALVRALADDRAPNAPGVPADDPRCTEALQAVTSCAVCTARLHHRRQDATTCSNRCRQAAYRRRRATGVTARGASGDETR